MSTTKKAVLLSALLFPGAGHYFLKRYIPAALLSLVTAGGLYFLIVETVVRSRQIADQILAGEISYDVATIAKLASTHSAGSDGQLLNNATTAIAVAWIIGMVDSYRVGRQQDAQFAAKESRSNGSSNQ
jgi:hypothetical protein